MTAAGQALGNSDFVQVVISLSGTSQPTTENLKVPMIACFHNHYPDRARTYATASVLTQMVTDGFSEDEAGWKAAAIVASQVPAPPNIVIGRRANPPLQILNFTCVDGSVGDAYALTLVGTDGKSHSISYTIVANFGTAVTGTVAVTNGSPDITFSTAQTMAEGDTLVFDSQPGVYYQLSAAITAGTSGVLTANYLGTTATVTTATHLAALAGTFGVTATSESVTTTSSQIGTVSVGDSIMFGSQLGVYYQVAAVTATTITLTTSYTGTTNAATHALDVATLANQAAAIEALIAAIENVDATIGTPSVASNVVTISRIDGALTDVQNWSSNLQLTDTTVDPGVVADLTAIAAADPLGWYAFGLDSNSPAEIKAADSYAESTGQGGKYFFTNTSDYPNVESDVTTDPFSYLQSITSERAYCEYNGTQLLCFAGLALGAQLISYNPGQFQAGWSSKTGVPVDASLTETQALILNTFTAANPGTGGKNGNYYRESSGLNVTWPGVVGSGEYVDTMTGIDALQIDMQAAIVAKFAGSPKVPLDDFGIGAIGDTIKGVLKTYGSASYGFLDPSTIEVTLPKAADLTPQQLQDRDLSGVTWYAELTEAVLVVSVQGVLTP